MGLFGKKKENFVDLSAGYSAARKFSQNNNSARNNSEKNSDLGFLGDMANSNSNSTSDNISWDNEPPPQQEENYGKKKLVKRFLEMTDKIEDLSNQIYHLKQRIELLEKKMKINFN